MPEPFRKRFRHGSRVSLRSPGTTRTEIIGKMPSFIRLLRLLAVATALLSAPAVAFAQATDDAFAWAGQLSAELFTSAEGKEGMAAYLAKRPPAWSPPSSR